MRDIEKIRIAAVRGGEAAGRTAEGAATAPAATPAAMRDFTLEAAQAVRAYHKTVPGYEQTPLNALSDLAGEIGLAGFYVKDESKRFGLNAFKGLGGSYAVARELAERFHIKTLDFNAFLDPAVNEQIRKIRFMTATDGNHGRGVAWFAHQLGGRAYVYMPKGSSLERLENIRAEGAEAAITEMNYDEAVAYVRQLAESDGDAIVFQDTTGPGYEIIPGWIMQGYSTLALECAEQLGGKVPTHIFLQAGVGAFAGSATAFFRNVYGEGPVITVVEPDAADCYYRSFAAGDGEPHTVEGDMPSIMAGLCCGVPCTIGWEIIKAEADWAVSCPDSVAEEGMRLLAHPRGGDPVTVSGESGAVTSGLVCELMTNEALRGMREQLGLGPDSVVLCVSTEGDTDKERYDIIVGGGSVVL